LCNIKRDCHSSNLLSISNLFFLVVLKACILVPADFSFAVMTLHLDTLSCQSDPLLNTVYLRVD
jgi:hypothetical protein